LLEALAVAGELGAEAIRTQLSLKDRSHARDAYINPALVAGLIERTIADKPTSRLQKYRLTEKGRRLANAAGESEDDR
jgi:ATP-dependent DNA helicase RecG